MSDVRVELVVSDELVETIAARAAEIVLAASAGPIWLTLDEAAERLRLSSAGLRKRAQRGTAPGAVKDGARWLFDARALDAGVAATLVCPDNKWGERRVNGPAPGQRRSKLR